MCPLVQKAAIVAGHAQKGRRGGGDTHQLTVLTAHRRALSFIMPITRDTTG